MALRAFCISLAGIAALGTAMADAPIVSPEIHPDHTVTLRFRAPDAKEVWCGVAGISSAKMTKDSAGTWSYTTPPLEPDIYDYTFDVDGASVLDPNNPLTRPSLLWRSNLLLVPGTPPREWEVQDVPHGTLHHHFYKSAAIGDRRDYYVYTPPEYRPNSRAKYPVLYLLHGYGGDAQQWSAEEMANVIMDNLLAKGKVKPMLVVMTLGYGISNFASTNGPDIFNQDIVQQNYDNYMKTLLNEVIPAVQSDYRASSNPADRAIAGLSMGGSESLYVGLKNPATFSHIGAFSAGGVPHSYDRSFPGLNANTVNRRLKQLWIACGTEDGFIKVNRETVQWLKDKKVRLTQIETPGRHSSMVWRRNLISFAPLLFR